MCDLFRSKALTIQRCLYSTNEVLRKLQIPHIPPLGDTRVRVTCEEALNKLTIFKERLKDV